MYCKNFYSNKMQVLNPSIELPEFKSKLFHEHFTAFNKLGCSFEKKIQFQNTLDYSWLVPNLKS